MTELFSHLTKAEPLAPTERPTMIFTEYPVFSDPIDPGMNTAPDQAPKAHPQAPHRR